MGNDDFMETLSVSNLKTAIQAFQALKLDAELHVGSSKKMREYLEIETDKNPRFFFGIRVIETPLLMGTSHVVLIESSPIPKHESRKTIFFKMR